MPPPVVQFMLTVLFLVLLLLAVGWIVSLFDRSEPTQIAKRPMKPNFSSPIQSLEDRPMQVTLTLSESEIQKAVIAYISKKTNNHDLPWKDHEVIFFDEGGDPLSFPLKCSLTTSMIEPGQPDHQAFPSVIGK